MLFDLSTYGVLMVTGPDSKKLLQGQLTCDMEKVNPTHGLLAAHCNAQGRVLSLFYIHRWDDSYFLIMPRSMVAITLRLLKKYAIFFKTEILDGQDEYSIFATSEENRHQFRDFSHSVSLTTLPYVLLLYKNNKPQEITLSLQDWQYLTIQHHIPIIYPETSSQFLPHDLGLHRFNAIYLDKGCYTGQEIITRMHHRGKLKKHLYHGIYPTSPAINISPGQMIISNSHECGTIIDCCIQDSFYNLLILMEDDYLSQNNLQIKNICSQQPLTITHSQRKISND